MIVGGGVVGTSLAYHLARNGQDEVLLLEQGELAGGTTWHAAGLVGRLRTSNSLTRINKASAELYARLERETGVSCGWRQTGSLILGRSKDRMTQLRRTVAMAEVFGVEAEIIDPSRCGELWPHIDADQVFGGAWLPHDGRVVPKDLVAALAAGARQNGARIHERVRVTEVLREGNVVNGVRTDDGGEIGAESVVLCGGMWTRSLARTCGVSVPLWPVEHHYVVSASIDGVHDHLPVGRDPDLAIYFRPEGDRIVLGAFQERSRAWNVDPVPGDFSFQLLDPDWETFEVPLAAGKQLIPALRTTEFPDFVNGPESFTPDNAFIMGPGPGASGLWLAAGFNSVGIASAGGAGAVLAEWMTDGHAPMDLWSVDPTRFAPCHDQRAFLESRVEEVLGLHYQMAWPNREFETGRDLIRSGHHDRLVERGARFGQKMGFERPNWFDADGASGRARDYDWTRPGWHRAVAREVGALRNDVAVLDQSSFSKLRIEGADAVALLQWLCANDVDVDPGRLVYTALLNERGTFESDVTVVREAADRFLVITSSAQTWHDYWWIVDHIDDRDVAVTDVTRAAGVLGLMGPRARDVLAACTDADLSNEAFPFASSRRIRIGDTDALALRITYVGELGWELHVPTDSMAAVYERLLSAGEAHRIRDAGHYAINACRLEKGYRAWGADISPDDTPLEAGLSRFCRMDIPFLGREAVAKQRAEGVGRRLMQFRLEAPDAMLWGQEPILRDGVLAGYTTSGFFGYTLGVPVGLGYVKGAAPVNKEWLLAGTYTIVVDGTPIPATASLQPFHDPRSERVRA